jgi:hypothetical protein
VLDCRAKRYQQIIRFWWDFRLVNLYKELNMEEEKNQDETLVAVVKKEEIESLPDLGFEDDGDLMVYKTNNGIVGVDKDTGMVAVNSGDSASVEEVAVVSELVANNVAEVVSTNELDAQEIEKTVDGANSDSDNKGDE